MKFNIAIDGPSAAGKSTIAKLLAKKLGFAHIDTGAMYRCVAYMCKKLNIDVTKEDDIASMMETMNISFNDKGNVFINDEDVSNVIRTNDISMLASKVSQFPKVRLILTQLQQKMALAQGFILDGRDIGTVVLPDAKCKIYMIASVKARADRRYKEYVEKQIEADYDEIYRDIENRDYQDTHRDHAPLKKADDAYEIDTSNMTIDEVVNEILSILEK